MNGFSLIRPLLMAVGCWLCLVFLGGLPTTPQAMAAASGTPMPQIKSVQVNEAATVWSFQANRSLGEARQFTTLKLPNPYRLIVDIPNTVLGKPETTIPVNRNGILRMELTDTRGRFYSASRITVFVENAATLNKLSMAAQDRALTLNLEQPTPLLAENKKAVAPDKPGPEPTFLPGGPDIARRPAGEFSSPLSPLTVLTDIYFRDNQLVLKTDDPAGLRIKSRTVLKSPTRLVLDLQNTVIAGKEQLAPIFPPAGQTGTVQSIRVGQFDERTIRLVFVTARPDSLGLFYPEPNKSVLLVRPLPASDVPASMNPPVKTGETAPAVALSNGPQGPGAVGQLENVYLDREGSDTVLRLASSIPMVFTASRPQPDRIIVELNNLNAQAGWIRYDKGAFPDVRYLKLENPPKGVGRLVVDLASAETRSATQLSADGRLLTMVLSNPANTGTNSGVSNPFTPGPDTSVPRRPRIKGQVSIVVDAGHGGKDLGANREGVNEKDLNLSVVLKLKRSLESRGLKVYLTRSEDVFLPLPEITRITNSIGPDLFVSVHTNSSTNPGITGLETYYYTQQSIPLAQAVHHQWIGQIDSPDRHIRSARFYVINHTPVPAILCEMGYISNAGERAELQTADRQQRTANAIADGVMDYLRQVGLLPAR